MNLEAGKQTFHSWRWNLTFAFKLEILSLFGSWLAAISKFPGLFSLKVFDFIPLEDWSIWDFVCLNYVTLQIFSDEKQVFQF